MTPCVQGLTQCYPRQKACVYERTTGEALAYCPSGAHLQGCLTFRCPQMFQCEPCTGYCIPLSHVCDGIIDCPNGQDEKNCSKIVTCPGKLKCQTDEHCLHQANVGDGEKDCLKSGDDERTCKNASCPPPCYCLDVSFFFCEDKNLRDIPQVHVLATSLFLHNNSIETMGWNIAEYKLLVILDVSLNSIKVLQKSALVKKMYLHIFNLSDNHISNIEKGVFSDTVHLKCLDLSRNPLKAIDVFHNLFSLEYLFIDVTDVKDMVYALKSISANLSEVVFSKVSPVCCDFLGKRTICRPKISEHKCQDLIPRNILKCWLWITVIFCLTLNLFSIFWQVYTGKRIVNVVYICNIAAANILFAVYLGILGYIDKQYMGQFYIKANAWNISSLCKIAAGLLCLYIEISVIITSLILIDIQQNTFSMKKVHFSNNWLFAVCGISWITGVLISLIATTQSAYVSIENNACLTLNILPNFSSSISTLMTSALLIFHIICASVSYIISYLVIKRIKESQNSMKLYDHHQLSRQRTFQHAHKQLVCLSALSSSFCSYNLIICTLLQSGIHFREEWHIWLAVIVLPINSVLFPILTSFTTNAFRAFLFSLFSKLSPNTSTHGII